MSDQENPTTHLSDFLKCPTCKDFQNAMAVMLEEHRPSRMPFFDRLANLPSAVVTDSLFLGEIHLVYQSAMHATRAAVYLLPHLDAPGLRKRKLQIFIDDDGLPGGVASGAASAKDAMSVSKYFIRFTGSIFCHVRVTCV